MKQVDLKQTLASVQRLDSLLTEEFEALKNQNLVGSRFRNEKVTILELLADLDIYGDSRNETQLRQVIDDPLWNEITRLLDRCKRSHQRNELLISKQLDSIRVHYPLSKTKTLSYVRTFIQSCARHGRRDGQSYLVMLNSTLPSQRSDPGILRGTVIIACLLLLIAVVNISQTSTTQWQPRPNINCDNGEAVHRFAFVNANRVNVRDLPTVFSNVLSQKNKNDPITVVCEFGVWSQY